MTRIATLLLAAALACASGPVPVSQTPIDWREANRWTLHVVTVDPDGDERVTRIWIAVVDGTGALRTGDSRWWQNLERDPTCRVRVLGTDYPMRVEFVTERAERARIDAAFGEKYGWMERILFPQDPGETHENYARLHAD